MTDAATVQWLAQLQARFGSALRTPLSASHSRLTSAIESLPAAACADISDGQQLTAAERLSIYHRQYWMRLLRTLQEQHPLCVGLLGAWFFNQYAVRFLSAHPPRSHDLGAIHQGFQGFLAAALITDPVDHGPRGPRLPRAALLEATCIDTAFRRVFTAPEQPVWSVPSADAATLSQRRLRLSEAVACFAEHWPLLELRARALKETAEHALALPNALPEPHYWLLRRSQQGLLHARLHARHAQLFELLAQHSVGDALDRLDATCPANERSRLPELVREFFEHAAQNGCFVGWHRP